MTESRPDDVGAVIARMESDLERLVAEDDPRRFFHAVYLRTTRAIADEVVGGGFADAGWVLRWDVAFAELYLDALDAAGGGGGSMGSSSGAGPSGGGGTGSSGGAAGPSGGGAGSSGGVSGPWRVAFGAPRDLPPLRHVLLGLNAHINYDLPQALLAVIPPVDFASPSVRAAREADHRHVDTVLASRVGAEDDELSAISRVTLLDRLLRPANRAASRRFLAEARAKVWRNAAALDAARSAGPDALAARLRELERLCAGRVQDLLEARQVLLTLAARGFGVVLPGA